jgi:hypothetical protein
VLDNIVLFVQQTESDFGLTSPVKKAADIFTMPLSYLYNQKEQRLEFIIHIPLTRQEQILDMYEYFPFPHDHDWGPRPGGRTSDRTSQRLGLQKAT